MVTRVLRGGALMLLGTSGAVAALQPAPPAYVWNLPAGFPAPRVPADNPMTVAKVELGRHLFYDTRLAANGTQSCGDCTSRPERLRMGRNGRSGRRAMCIRATA